MILPDNRLIKMLPEIKLLSVMMCDVKVERFAILERQSLQ